jgi:alkylation response protein AidB-like acyl-CoA dehydrogenase
MDEQGISGEPILQEAERFLREEVAPRAQEIDADPEALRSALDGLCRRNLMAIRRPPQYGGPGLSEPAFRQFQESVARYSGALAFLQTQHQSAGSMISKSPNQRLKEEYLPQMGDGRKLVGIGFSQLRRPGPPVLRAEPVAGGYRLNGSVPWLTGWTFYPEFLVGATLPSGEAVFGVLPFQPSEASGASIRFSEPMRLAAMESPLTVSAELENWLLPEELVCFVQRAGWIQNNDMINITLQGHFALGCARAGLDVLDQAAQKKPLPFLARAHHALQEELEECRAATTEAHAQPNEETTEERLRIRAWAIDLAVRCAHAAVAASSGAANSLSHPAQRVYREALVYTVSAQTSAIMEATLDRLVRPS